MDRFSTLTVFRRVVELGSFSAAAQDLNYSNAAVSKMIKELEADLGAQLIVRTTRSLRLTDVGRSYFEQVSEILDGVTAADDAVRSEAGIPRGQLKISAPMSFGLVIVSKLLPRFAMQYPEIRIDLVMSDSFVDIIEHGFDLAIRGGQLADSSLKARKLADIERILCSSPAYLTEHGFPADPTDLTEHACLVYSASTSPDIWHLKSGSDRRSISIRAAYRANNSLAIREAVLEGLGIGFLPKVYVANDIASGELINILPDWKGEPQALYVLYPAHRESSLKHRLLVDFLANAFASL
jgi:DNA-binding transcriptional LysR family regulator